MELDKIKDLMTSESTRKIAYLMCVDLSRKDLEEMYWYMTDSSSDLIPSSFCTMFTMSYLGIFMFARPEVVENASRRNPPYLHDYEVERHASIAVKKMLSEYEVKIYRH